MQLSSLCLHLSKNDEIHFQKADNSIFRSSLNLSEIAFFCSFFE